MRVCIELQLKYGEYNKSEWLLKTVTMPYPLPVGSRYHAEPDRKDCEYERSWEVLDLLWHEQDENYYIHIGSDTKKFNTSQMAELLKHYKNHGWKKLGEDD